MRMFLLFILLLCPFVASAVVPPEHCRDATDCQNTAGCFYHNLNGCIQCDADHFCPGTNNTQTSCSSATNENFIKSVKGSENEHECYKSIECRDATDTPQPCRHYNTTNNPYRCGDDFQTLAHTESETCYYNARLCKAFGVPTGCDNGEITGGALWNNGQWNIQGCKCIQEGTQYQSCIASIEKTPTTTNQPSAQDSITYNNISYYFCTGCPAGSYVKPDTDFQTNSNCYAIDSSVLIVCQCTNVERGYYGAGVNNINYSILNTSVYSQSPYRNPCPAGQTTDNTGATSVDACKYTEQTKFCDSQGCFTLDDVDDWTITL